MSILKTGLKIGAALGGSYIAYRLGTWAWIKWEHRTDAEVLERLENEAEEQANAPGKTGYRSADGTYHKVRTMRDPNRDK